MIDYNGLSDDELQSLYAGKTKLWIGLRNKTNNLCTELNRCRDDELEMGHELALINMEIYRRREE